MLGNRDGQLKKERGYHGKSYVRPDGSECLLDKRDWELRKWELWKRSGGRCEHVNGEELRCIQNAIIPAHIVPRYPIRDDRLENLKAYCKYHDRLTERQNWRKPRFGEGSKPVQKRLGGKA